MNKKDSKLILIIDSKASRRDTIASRFRLQGYETDLSNSGFQTLSLVEKNPYNTVILIGNLFDMSSIELIGLIRSIFKKEELQLIYSDNKKSDAEVLELLELGVSDFIIYSDKLFGSVLDRVNSFKAVRGKMPKSILNND